MEDERFYRSAAREARKLAAQSSDGETRQSWLVIAKSYDALAESARDALVKQQLSSPR
jgi:hypothetical protein